MAKMRYPISALILCSLVWSTAALADPFIYSLNGASRVSKYDLADGRRIASSLLEQASNLEGGVAVRPQGDFVYVADAAGGKVFKLTASTLRPLAHADIAAPEGMALSTNGDRLYVASLAGGVYVLNADTLQVIGEILTSCPDCASGVFRAVSVAVSPAGVAVASTRGVDVAIFDSQLTLRRLIKFPDTNLGQVSISSDGRRAFITKEDGPGGIEAIDTRTGEAIFQAGASALKLAVASSGKKILLIDNRNQRLQLVDGQSGVVLKTIDLTEPVVKAGDNVSADLLNACGIEGDVAYCVTANSNYPLIVSTRISQFRELSAVGDYLDVDEFFGDMWSSIVFRH